MLRFSTGHVRAVRRDLGIQWEGLSNIFLRKNFSEMKVVRASSRGEMHYPSPLNPLSWNNGGTVLQYVFQVFPEIRGF